MLDVLHTVAGAATRWLTLDRDVVVRGDLGSGRSTVLAAIAQHGERSRLRTVLLDRHDPAGGPRRTGSRRPRTSRSADEVVDGLVEDLGQRGVLLVDDLDLYDPELLDVVVRTLGRSGALLVATVSRDLARTVQPALARLVASRAPAEVRIPPLGYRSMARLIGDRLGGPADAALVSSVTAWSAGNPAVAAAVVDAIQFSGLVERRDQFLTATGDLEQVPLDAVAHLLQADLSPCAKDALEVLSVLGPAATDVVQRLVSADALAELTRRNRVVSYRGDVLAVSPPALARAVRSRLTELRGLEVAALTTTQVGARELPLATVRTGLTDLILASDGEQYAGYWRWAAELTGLVHERAVVDEASARSAWEDDPRVGTALPYLATLLRRPGTDRTHDVFMGTTREDDEAAHERDLFDLFRQHWTAWGASGSVAGAPAMPERPGPTSRAALQALAARAAADGWDDRALWQRLAPPLARAPEPERSLALVRAASVLLEAGRVELVLRIADETVVPAWMPAETAHSLAGLRTLALLLADRVPEAEAFARAHLEDSYDALDLAGIRVHSITLAHTLTVVGQWTAAWRVLTIAMRLGPPGPLGSAFHRRTMALATTLASIVEQGQDAADSLLADLHHAEPLHEPVIDPMQGVAEAYVQIARGRPAEAEDVLWRSGARSLAAGRPMPALQYWVLRVSVSTPEQVEQMRALDRAMPLPLLSPLVDVHAALLGDDPDELVRAARAARLEMVPGLVPQVVQTLACLRRTAGLPPLTDAEVDDLLGERLADGLRTVQRAAPAQEPLSSREREVAELAAEGLTNREIAVRLHLSPRTVENHVHRALRKTGAGSRFALAEANR